MHNEFPFAKRRNPVTQQAHRKQVLWQITVPLFIAAIVILVLAFLVASDSSQGASLWADIALIWLIIPVMVASLIVLVLLATTGMAVWMWYGFTHPYRGYASEGVFVTVPHGASQRSVGRVRARDGELALSVARTQLTHVHPHWDLHRVARKMSDFNLTVLPVLDEEHGQMIGVVTVDDLLEELLPQGWRREFGMTAVEE